MGSNWTSLSSIDLWFHKNLWTFSFFIKRFFHSQLIGQNCTLFCYFANWKAFRYFCWLCMNINCLIKMIWSFIFLGAYRYSKLTKLWRHNSKAFSVQLIRNKVCTYKVINVFGWLKNYISLVLLIIMYNFDGVWSR